MNRGTQSFLIRCIGGNFPPIVHSWCHSRPKTNALFPFYSIHRTRANPPQYLNEHRQCSYTSNSMRFSSASSTNTNSDNTAQSSTETSSDEIKQTVPLTFIEADGKERLVQAEIGKHLLDVAHDNHVELEGACGGELSCSTCHLIFEPHVYEKLAPKLDDEQDMLDLAFGVTETSRLGCQIRVTKELEGIKVQIPDDGF